MPEQKSLVRLCCDVQDNDRVSVNVDGLISNDQLPAGMTPVVHGNICITNIQFILVLN